MVVSIAISSGVSVSVGSGVTITVGTASISVSVSVTVVGISLGLSISRPLAESLGGPGHEAGGRSGVASNAGSVPVESGGVAVVSTEISGLGISGPLASAPEAGGGGVGGGDSGPVGVGVVEGRGVAVAVVGIGISLRGSHSRGDGSANNLKEKVLKFLILSLVGMCFFGFREANRKLKLKRNFIDIVY